MRVGSIVGRGERACQGENVGWCKNVGWCERVGWVNIVGEGVRIDLAKW